MDSSFPATEARAASFAIGDVSAMTGISEATLRVWERRYGFPRLARSSGGHRQYSQLDVLRLRWVKLQMDMGMRASRAIQSQTDMARDVAVAASLTAPLPPCPAADAALETIQARLLAALVAYDSAAATAILKRARAAYPVERIALHVIGPVLSMIGEAWSAGVAGIAAEHFATNYLRHQMLDWISASPPPFDTPPIALACAPGELHDGSLLMIGVVLRQLRWPVIYLGQSLPLSDIGALVNHVHPALIVFVAMSEAPARALAEWPQALDASADAAPMPIIGFGGRAFTNNPDLAKRVPGALLGATLCEGCQRINHFMLHRAVLRE